MPQHFAEKLRSLRQQHGLTQLEVAQRLGLAAHVRIAQLESEQASGRMSPSLELVVRLAVVFGVTTDYLLRDTIPVDPLPSAGSGGKSAPVSLQPRLGQALRTLRERRNLSQGALARQLELAYGGYIGNIEVGRKTPSLDLIVRIANLFGVTTDALLRGETAT